MIDPSVFALIKELLSTHSPQSHKLAIQAYIIKHADIQSQKDDIDTLLSFVDGQIAMKAIQGRTSHQNDKKNTSYSKPKFFSDNKDDAICKTCKHAIDSTNCFKHKTKGAYTYYHALPECFPGKYAHHMGNDKDYITFTQSTGETEQ